MSVTFLYKARDAAGHETTGRITAPNKIVAINLLRQEKLFVIEILPVTTSSPHLGSYITPKVPLKELSLFCRQFATLIAAGIPIISSLHTLHLQTENKSLKNTLQDLVNQLEAGQSLAQALAKHPRIFPDICQSLIEAGEFSGSLENALDQLANYFEQYHELREKFRTAITYPLFIICVSLISITSVLFFMLPTFTQVILDLQAPIPWPTAMVMSVSEWIRGDWYNLIVLFLLLGLGCKAYLSTASGKQSFDRGIFHIPVYGKLIRQFYVVRFCRTLALLLTSGMPLLAALTVIKNQLANTVVQQAIEQSINSLQQGEGLSGPLQRVRVFPAMMPKMIGVGEETGELEKLLSKTSDFYERELYQAITRLTTLLEPILICLMGGIIGLVMLSILLPMFSIMDTLQ